MADETVFLVWHHHGPAADSENDKLLGVFSSKTKAESRIARARGELGFADHPDGFTIDEYMLDSDAWTEGFVEIDPDRWVGWGFDAALPSAADPLPDGEV